MRGNEGTRTRRLSLCDKVRPKITGDDKREASSLTQKKRVLRINVVVLVEDVRIIFTFGDTAGHFNAVADNKEEAIGVSIKVFHNIIVTDAVTDDVTQEDITREETADGLFTEEDDEKRGGATTANRVYMTMHQKLYERKANETFIL